MMRSSVLDDTCTSEKFRSQRHCAHPITVFLAQAPPEDFCADPNGAPFEMAFADLGLAHCRVPVSTTCYKKIQDRMAGGNLPDKQAACQGLLVSSNPDDWQCRDNCKNGDSPNFSPRKSNNQVFDCNTVKWSFYDQASEHQVTLSCAAVFNQQLYTNKYDSVVGPNPELRALADAAFTEIPADTEVHAVGGDSSVGRYPCAEYNDAICAQFSRSRDQCRVATFYDGVHEVTRSCNAGAVWLLDNGGPGVAGNLQASCAKQAETNGCQPCGQ